MLDANYSYQVVCRVEQTNIFIAVIGYWFLMCPGFFNYQGKYSFSKLSVASPTSQLILQPFRRVTYVTAHSPSFPSLHLRHIFSNRPVAFPTSQLIFQPFRSFTYVTAHSPTLLSLILRHRLFTYVTWLAAHGCQGDNCDRKCRDFGGFSSAIYSIPNFIPPSFSALQSPPTSCHFIFSFIHFMPCFILFTVNKTFSPSFVL